MAKQGKKNADVTGSLRRLDALQVAFEQELAKGMRGDPYNTRPIWEDIHQVRRALRPS